MAGPVIAAAGFALLALPGIGGSYWTTFFPGMAVLGLGMAVSVAPLTTTMMGAVPDHFAGAASGINNAVARLAGMLAVAILGTMAVGMFGAALERRLVMSRVSPDIRHALLQEVPKLAEARVPEAVAPELRATLDQAVAESFVSSFRAVMLAATAVAVLSAVCAALTITTPRLAGRPPHPGVDSPRRVGPPRDLRSGA